MTKTYSNYIITVKILMC